MDEQTYYLYLRYTGGAVIGLLFGVLHHEVVHISLFHLYGCKIEVFLIGSYGFDCFHPDAARTANRMAEAVGYHILPFYLIAGAILVNRIYVDLFKN